MGEMADWYNDQMQEANPSWLPVGDPFRGRRSAYVPTCCKHCGSQAVYWLRVKGKYVLHDKDAATVQRHNCRSTPDTEGFTKEE